MHTRIVFVKPQDKELTAYFDRQTHLAKNLRNSANYLIRNLNSGLHKEPDERTENEKEVIETVATGINLYNKHLNERIMKKFSEICGLSCPTLAKTCMIHELFKKDKKEYPLPDKEHWMLNFYSMDVVMRHTKNKDYYAMPVQASQHVLKKVDKNWKSFFKAMQTYKVNPNLFTGRPKPPGYVRGEHTTVSYPNQTVRARVADGKTYLSFPGYKDELCVGNEASKLVRTEVKPCFGGYRVYATFEDEVSLPAVPETPERILGIDPGVGNFATCATNFPSVPFIIDGAWIKSANQGFNKTRARLISELTRGYDSKKSVKNSKRLDAISRKRDDQFRDFFYKVSHYIVDRCIELKIEAIVFGHNKMQKQNSNMGTKSNQQFVSIPFLTFSQILTNVAAKSGIPVVHVEESYSSKGSLIDGDYLPVYNKEKEEAYEFSGRRISRGQYKTKDGIILNADVNGAGNIIRKAFPDAFDKIEDYSYLHRTVIRIKREQICGAKVKTLQGLPKRKDMHAFLHHERMAKKNMYMEIFGATSAKNKSVYIEAARAKKEEEKAKKAALEAEMIAAEAEKKPKAA